MNKLRFILSCIMIAVGLVIHMIVTAYTSYVQNPNNKYYDVYFDNCTDSVVSYLSENSFSNIHLNKTTNENSTIIFTMDSSKEFSKDYYTSYTIGYSPIVLCYPRSIMDHASKNFSESSVDSRRNYYVTDISKLLAEIQSSSTGDISKSQKYIKFEGLNGLSNELYLGIPSKSEFYRDDVINAIICALANKDINNDNDAEKISKDLDDIVSKSKDILNPSKEIIDSKDRIIMVPEFLESYVASSSEFAPVYYSNCYAVTLRMIVRRTENSEILKKLADSLKSDSKLFQNTSVRNDAVSIDNSRSLHMLSPYITNYVQYDSKIKKVQNLYETTKIS